MFFWKELLELQHAHHELSRQCQAKTELTHANNRGDQNEAEVKKLRFRVEELKQRLDQKEDKVPYKTTYARQLQNNFL